MNALFAAIAIATAATVFFSLFALQTGLRPGTFYAAVLTLSLFPSLTYGTPQLASPSPRAVK